MTEGVHETKGTKIYFGYTPEEGSSTSDPPELVVHLLACPTGIPDLSAGEKPRQDMTCLSSQSRQYYDGLADPPQIQIPVNFIPRSESHQDIIDAKARGRSLLMPWMVAFSDLETAPTTVASNGLFNSPGPTNVGFLGYVSNFVVNAAIGEIWKGTLTVQLQLPDDVEDLAWDLPTADLP